MSDTTKQALQRFAGALIAELVSVGLAFLASPELGRLLAVWAEEGSVLAAILVVLVPPIALGLAKVWAGATQKTEPIIQGEQPRGYRRVAAGRDPGLFG